MPVACKGAHILIVDDDPKYRGFVVEGLSESGLRAVAVGDLARARAQLADERFDLILLDVMMADDDGRDLLATLRAEGDDIPVILVTAKDETGDRIGGLRLGADDYVVKPFAFAELLARIDAVLRRRTGAIAIGFGNLSIDPAARKVTCRDKTIELSPKEFDVLSAFVRARGAAVSRKDLLSTAWGVEHDPQTNVVDVFVARLRRKLAAVGGPVIETVRGVGYRLDEGSART